MPGKEVEMEGPDADKKTPYAPPVLNAGYTAGNKTDVFPACVEFTVRWRGRGIKRKSCVIIEVQTGINVVKGRSKGELWCRAVFSGEWHFCRAAHLHWDANKEALPRPHPPPLPPPPRGNAMGEGGVPW